VFVTAYASVVGCRFALDSGAVGYFEKPVEAMDLMPVLTGKIDKAKPLGGRSPLTLREAEWEYLHEALCRNNWRLLPSAKELGIHRQSLQRKLKKPPR
jgi:two-component system response regulator RegA